MYQFALIAPCQHRRTGFAVAICALLATCSLAAHVQAQAPGWNFRTNVGPAPRYNFAMCYDPVREQSIIFSGYGPAGKGKHFGDTWEWDGTAWVLKSDSGPIDRFGTGLAYDPVRNMTLMFGGHYHLTGQLGDTWEWNGTSWTFRTDGVPLARDNHAMVWDTARQRAVVFGGYTGFFVNDTWEWDGTSWTQVNIVGTAPPGRWFHAMAYDSARGRTVLFGGDDGVTTFGDTWEWDGTAWALKSTSGPSARAGHAMAFDSATKRTVLFGGGAPADTWEWDGTVWTRRSVSGPSQRIGPVMAYDSVRDRVVLFGGVFGSYFGDTWEYRGVRLGDMNVDGKVDGLDIAPLVAAILTQPMDATNVYIGDFNGNSILDTGDVTGVVAALL